jgi:hormone-sensitive lipase
MSNPDPDTCSAIWNALENKTIKALMGTVLPSIKVNNKIYIPMIDSPESLDITNIMNRTIPEIKRIDGEILFGDHDSTYNPETHVKVRVLSSQKLPVDLKTGEDSRIQKHKTSFFFLPSKPLKLPKHASNNIDKVVIHIHGGGFVAMSSGSHQNYSRIWANELGIPVISIDYRLAPKWKFPCALIDVWQVYYWLIERGC